MSVTDGKVLVHFNSNGISVYSLKNNTFKTLSEKRVAFEEIFVIELMLNTIDIFLNGLQEYAGVVNNERIRLYATGIFQELTPVDQIRFINHIYINSGLYFNIVHPELEQFYFEKSMSIYGSKNIMKGLIHQEYRNVVVCGSFQQHLKEIEDLITCLRQRNIIVLSPWTTNVRPETAGSDFILFDYQDDLKNERDTWRHKYEHMEKFKQSDAVIVCNPNGLIGKGTIFEFGFALTISKKILFTEKPKRLSVFFPYEVGLNF